MDIVKIKLWVPDQVALNEILSAAKVSLDCGSPRRDETGNFVITLYATKAEAKKSQRSNTVTSHRSSPNACSCRGSFANR